LWGGRKGASSFLVEGRKADRKKIIPGERGMAQAEKKETDYATAKEERGGGWPVVFFTHGRRKREL